MSRSPLLSLAFALVLAPVSAAAQRGAAPPFEGPRGFFTFDLTEKLVKYELPERFFGVF